MTLTVRTGQHSEAGQARENQDFHGLCLPREPQRSAKGVVLALADGIGSSDAGRLASQAAVGSFLADYYSTSDAWSVKHSASRVLAAVNSWLYAQTQQGHGRFDKDRGWVCTFSALVLRSRTAHLFHVGDARIWQLQGRTLEPLTSDHRVQVGDATYLGRALGVAAQVEIDYRAVPLEPGDTFVLATDGVHEHLRPEAMAALLADLGDDLDAAARAIVHAALAAGSRDNLTVQVVRIEQLPAGEPADLAQRAAVLAAPTALAPRMLLDGLRIVRELHQSHRSQVWLAVDLASGEPVALKVPAVDLQANAQALEAFQREEWVARRVDSPHLLKAWRGERPRSALYVAMEYAEGATLAQWMVDHPRAGVDAVRRIVDQLARGLRALHRMEMVHRDLRPENVLVDATGTVRIIDFGAVQVAGLAPDAPDPGEVLPGSLSHAAPELFLGAEASPRSDLFSLAVLAYQLLTGRLPYGVEVAKCRSLAQQRRLRYQAATTLRPDLPDWLDETLRKALHPDPQQRHADVAEFAHALRTPLPAGPRPRRVPLVQRDPLRFWQGLSLLLGLGWLLLLGWLALAG